MNKKEFATIADVLHLAYGEDVILPDEKTLELWYGFLKDIDYAICKNAVMRIISTSKWPPKIADIREAAVQVVTVRETADWSEAWSRVIRAIGRFGQNRQEEALEYMGEDAARIVMRMGWKNICLSENISVERANFRQAYENHRNSSNTLNQIPAAVRLDMMALAERANGEGIGVRENEIRICGEIQGQQESLDQGPVPADPAGREAFQHRRHNPAVSWRPDKSDL